MINQLIRKLYGSYCELWKSYKWVICLFFLALLCDAASTIYFMQNKGDSTEEIHLGIRFVSMIFGPIIGPLVGAIAKAIAGILVAIYWRRIGLYILVAASIISFWAAWYNIWGVNIYFPNILRWIPW